MGRDYVEEDLERRKERKNLSKTGLCNNKIIIIIKMEKTKLIYYIYIQ